MPAHPPPLPLAHVYCPVNFSEFPISIASRIVPIVQSLRQVQRLNMLIVAESGMGKTTCLRAIIREIHPLNSTSDSSLFDDVLWTAPLRELGGDKFRNAVYAFCQGRSRRRKTVVIDDVDLLGDTMQHAIRAVVDKYGGTVNFVGTCTNVGAVHESLQSRLTMTRLPVMTDDELLAIVDRVCASNNMHMASAAREALIRQINGSPKTLMCFMERFLLLNRFIDEATVHTADGSVSPEHFARMTEAALTGHLEESIQIVCDLCDVGHSAIDLLDAYFSFVNTTPLLTSTQKYAVIPVISDSIVSLDTMCDDELCMIFFCNRLVGVLRG